MGSSRTGILPVWLKHCLKVFSKPLIMQYLAQEQLGPL